MVERVPQILKFVPHGKGRILVKRVYADENGPQLSAGMIRAEKGAWNVELDYPEITASFATLALAQAFCQGYCAAKGWTIPPDGTSSADDAETLAEHVREHLALETPRSIQDALAGRLRGADAPDLEMRLRKLETLAHEPYDFAHLIERLERLEGGYGVASQEHKRFFHQLNDVASRVEKLEKLAHEHFVNTEDVKTSPGRGR